MKAFFLALLAVIGIGIGASFVLNTFQGTVDRPVAGSGARPDPEPRLLAKPNS